jgi:hypothetical protein
MSRRQRRTQEKRQRHASRRMSRRLALGVGLTVSATLAAGGVAEASSFTVDKTADDAGGGACLDANANDCSLRSAIQAANANPNFGNDVILFDSALSGAVTLSSDLPTITDEVDFYGGCYPCYGDGGGSRVEIDGNGHKIFDVNVPPPICGYYYGYPYTCRPGLVIFQGLTLSGAADPGGRGAAIENHQGKVSVSDSRLLDNTADKGGAIYDDPSPQIPPRGFGAYLPGTVTDLFRSTLSGNEATVGGGGAWVSNGASSRAYASTFSGNTAAGDGGAVLSKSPAPLSDPANGGSIDLIDSTISGNTAGGSGGGVAADQREGYIHCAGYEFISRYNNGFYDWYCKPYASTQVYGGQTRLFATTVSGNTATAGGAVSENVRLRTDAHPYNHYASYDDPKPVYLGDGIFSDSAAGVADLASTNSHFGTAFDLIEHAGTANVTETIASSNILGVDPQLGALADNGGATYTQALAATSPAVDQGAAGGSPQTFDLLSYDQRFFVGRISDDPGVTNSSASGADGSDMGAFERDPVPPDTVIDDGPTGVTGDSTPTFTFHSTETHSTFQCSIDTGTPNFQDCGSSGDYTPADPLADGAYTFRVRAIDGSSNTDPTPATRSFTVQTTPSGGGGGGGGGGTPSNAITLGKPKLNVRKGTALLPVTVASTGAITLTGRQVKPQLRADSSTRATRGDSWNPLRRVVGPGTVKLLVKPRGKAKRKLRAKGKAKVVVTITFTPNGGVANAQTKTVRLRKKLH